MIVRALWSLAPRRPFRAPTRGIFGQSFEVGEIQAVRRNEVGSKNAQWARQHQLIPGIVYGYDEEGRDAVDLVYVKEQDLRREVNRRGRSFSNTLYDMCVPEALGTGAVRAPPARLTVSPRAPFFFSQ